ncbi:MAG: GNAT family N-acetyltransferase [Bacteroidota bacterium]
MSTDPSTLAVFHNAEKNRFEVTERGLVAKAEYMVTKDARIVFTHTEVPAEWEGKGVGSRLAKTGLTYARDHDLKVMPLCPFIASYVRRHREEYQDLLAPGFNV